MPVLHTAPRCWKRRPGWPSEKSRLKAVVLIESCSPVVEVCDWVGVLVDAALVGWRAVVPVVNLAGGVVPLCRERSDQQQR